MNGGKGLVTVSGTTDPGPGPTLWRVATTPAPTVFIDGGDLACGELLLLVYGRVRHEQPGTQVTIRTTDPAAPIDIPAWCHLTGHLYQGPLDIDTDQRNPDFTDYCVELSASSRPVDPAHPWHPQPTTEAIP